MKYKIVTVPMLDPEQGEDELNRFLSSNKIVPIEKQFCQLEHSAYWTFAISYLGDLKDNGAGRKRNAVDYKEVLDDDDFKRFSRLRELRNSLAKDEGKPAYSIFTNEQLANMVVKKVKSKAGLAVIDGIGESRLKHYAGNFLPLLTEMHGEQQE